MIARRLGFEPFPTAQTSLRAKQSRATGRPLIQATHSCSSLKTSTWRFIRRRRLRFRSQSTSTTLSRVCDRIAEVSFCQFCVLRAMFSGANFDCSQFAERASSSMTIGSIFSRREGLLRASRHLAAVAPGSGVKTTKKRTAACLYLACEATRRTCYARCIECPQPHPRCCRWKR